MTQVRHPSIPWEMNGSVHLFLHNYSSLKYLPLANGQELGSGLSKYDPYSWSQDPSLPWTSMGITL